MADIIANKLALDDGNTLVLRDADAQAKVATHTQKIASLETDTSALKDGLSDLSDDLNEAIEEFAVPTQEAVNNWLTAHPEATTTVQDASLTEVKFSDALKKKTIKDYVTPEMYGAKGDGVTDDTQAIISVISSNSNVQFQNDKTYLISPLAFNNLENVFLTGRNVTLKIDNSNNSYNNTGIITLNNCKNIVINGLTFTTTELETNDENTDVTSLFRTGMYGIYIRKCEKITVTNCNVSLVKDGISTENCENIIITNNFVYNCGQEPIAIRHTKNCLVSGNNCFWHLGDGILIKAYESDEFWGITITDNFLHDGKTGTITDIQGNIYINMGGGVTCNAETIVNGYTTKGVIISNNHFVDIHYAVCIGNICNAVVSNNIAKIGLIDGAFNSIGFGMEVAPINNLSDVTLKDVIFSNNICEGGRFCYYARITPSNVSVTLENIVFDSNIGHGNSDNNIVTEAGMSLSDCTVKNNLIYGTRFIGYFKNCHIVGNTFKDNTLQDYSTPSNAGIQITGSVIFENNTLFDTNMNVLSDDGLLKGNNVITDNTTTPYIIVVDTSSGKVSMFDNMLNGKKIRNANVRYGRNSNNVIADFYRYLTVNGNTRIGKNYNSFQVWINSATDSGVIGAITDSFFIPPEDVQVICIMNGEIARVSVGTSGTIAVRATASGTLTGTPVGYAFQIMQSLS